MGNCGSNISQQDDSEQDGGGMVNTDRMNTLEAQVAELKAAQKDNLKIKNDLETQLASLQEDNNTLRQEQDEVHNVITGYEETMDKLVKDKDYIIKQLQVG